MWKTVSVLLYIPIPFSISTLKQPIPIKPTEQKKWNREEFHIKEGMSIYLLRNRHGPMVVRLCLAARSLLWKICCHKLFRFSKTNTKWTLFLAGICSKCCHISLFSSFAPKTFVLQSRIKNIFYRCIAFFFFLWRA